ncbi:hypothetical protein CGCA056_v004758 [Colletotrichum aenigma]|uniref:uncharacterized protein n=1 Tax=Colletotrichum aenigma TaxID=1215731 RepID=UPI00187261F4|nr:uncharacterized protein CGCA056_v004758 [Colletotrichum aenigma]KAF5524666.1 hypothetical protein CGCA056_v004758 [Colletotrichum aenigma]
MGQAVWSDNNNNAGAFFVWGGEASYDDDVIPSKVWRFQADGVGRGSWEHALVSNQKDFTKIKRPMGGAFAQIGNVGYYVDEKWHTQRTTGEQPTRRQKFCTVSVNGPDNTYDIFMYGGSTRDDGISDEVYVLTLPGFNFLKASSTSSTARFNHACVRIGKRHMLSMSWVHRYNDSAEQYESPEVVKKWYNEGGRNNVEWSSEQVKLLFASSKWPHTEEQD